MSPCHPSYAGAVLCCLAAPLRARDDGDPSPQELAELGAELVQDSLLQDGRTILLRLVWRP